jgi:hypothetical protein
LKRSDLFLFSVSKLRRVKICFFVFCSKVGVGKLCTILGKLLIEFILPFLIGCSGYFQCCDGREGTVTDSNSQVKVVSWPIGGKDAVMSPI